ncbi:MAG: DEAD/DEAH box helicase [Acidimicrobiales bacterium]|nr:DEAD/DEAH box helicase [Acidimicrobiales bacterium]
MVPPGPPPVAPSRTADAGTSRPPSVRLRPWQRAAFDRFVAHDTPDYLAVATPGAGKTTFALTCARWALGQDRRRLVVVAPTSHLKHQWALAAHRLGLELDPDWTPAGGLARDVHGLVTTYQHIATAGTAKVLRGLADGAFVILDEIHHAGDERAWGDSVRLAFERAHRRLCLSGTPFRSDTSQIPFVEYETTAEGEQARSHYTYGYADALRDGGVVRPVYFPRFDGVMEWSAPDGSVISANFHDELARDQMAQRLRAALSLDGDWLSTVVRQAHERLMAIRQAPDGQRDAGGLVIAMDQQHAHGIAAMIRRHFGVPAEVVVSDDPTASDRIAKFATTDAPWLVAVRMVSEGVDIPRLRVGVYATTVSTELFFRQAVGRFVRWQAGNGSQKAYVYLPDDPRLRTHAFQIAEARRHVLRPPAAHDEIADVDAAAAELDRAETADDPEQLSLFSVLSAVATGVSVHTVTAEGVAFDDEPDAIDGWDAPDDGDAPLDLHLPDIPTDAGFVREGQRSTAEIKEDLRARNAFVAQRLVDLTGLSHGKVNAEMNRLAGIAKVSAATTEQLERRLRYAESWLRRTRGR